MSRIAMFVTNDARFDSRVRREASSLAAEGHVVTLLTPAPALSAPQELPGHDGSFEVIRVRAPRPLLGGKHRWEDLRDRPWQLLRREARYAWRGQPRRGRPRNRRRALGIVAGLLPWTLVRAARRVVPIEGRSVGDGPSSGIRWLAEWRDRVTGWAQAAARAAPQADVYHGHDLDGLRAALAASARHPGARVVYDCHDLMLVAGPALVRPAWARWILKRVQRRWIAGADAVVTVSGPMARELESIGAPVPVVVRNCSVRWQPADGDESPLRRAIGVDHATPVVIYHGGFYVNRGLETMLACAARPELADCAFVFLGYGKLERLLLDAAAQDPRIHVLPAVTPTELPRWLSGADVGVAVCSFTPNHAVSIPNKLLEWLMAGVPMVVSDFAPWRDLVCDDPYGPFGRAVDPRDHDAITGAIAEVLAMSRADPAVRARLRRAALERLNWETEVQGLVRLYESLSREAVVSHA